MKSNLKGIRAVGNPPVVMSWTSRSWSISREEDDDEPVLYEKDVCVKHLATFSSEEYSEEWHTESAVECSKDPEPNHWTTLEDVQPLHESKCKPHGASI